jgi:hypothetical protein
MDNEDIVEDKSFRLVPSSWVYPPCNTQLAGSKKSVFFHHDDKINHLFFSIPLCKVDMVNQPNRFYLTTKRCQYFCQLA